MKSAAILYVGGCAVTAAIVWCILWIIRHGFAEIVAVVLAILGVPVLWAIYLTCITEDRKTEG